MTKKQKKNLTRIIVAGIIFAAIVLVTQLTNIELLSNKYVQLGLYLVPYIIVAYDIIIKAFKNIRHGQVFDENFLMMIASVGAFVIGEYMEASAVMIFYQVGELFQSYAVDKSRKSIADMMDIVPEIANVEVDGEITEEDPDDVEIGSIIVIKPGERVPIDAVVIEGDSLLDTSALTGESVPRRIKAGDELISGCINLNSVIKARTTKAFEDSTVARILELVENASSKKAKTENFITKFARYYTPIVTIAAVILAVIPPIIIGGDVFEWVKRACSFLVISCPCALVISVPMGFFGGIGAASKLGVLVKGSNYLEAMANIDTIVFDKTGTLTKGNFKVSEIRTEECTEEHIIEMAALGEGYSNHPVAASIKEAYGKDLNLERVSNSEEIAGHGISAYIDGKHILIGNDKLMKSNDIDYTVNNSAGTVIYVAEDGIFLGSILISDTIKDGAADAIKAIKACGTRKCVMLTGDSAVVAKDVAEKIGIDEVHAELLPGDKVDRVEELLNSTGDRKLAFVGDGINDAPVLTRADIGIAMGSMGSDAAIEAADVVIMDDNIGKLASVVKVSRKTLRIVKQNIVFAIGVKLAVLALSVFGITTMWAAVFADVGVAVIAILNAMRALKIDK